MKEPLRMRPATLLIALALMLAVASPSTAVDFPTKCQGPGVIQCWGFDTPDVLFYNWPTGTVCDAALAGKTNNPFGLSRSGPGNTVAVVQNGQCYFPTIDTSIVHSGTGSLKVALPTNSSAGTGGYFSDVFQRLGSGKFGYIGPGSSLGNVLYFQFYQRFDPVMVGTNYSCIGGGCGGWKQIIWFGNPPNGSSSSTIEVTHVNGWQRNVPQMYGQQGHDDYGIEDVAGCTYAKATSQGGSGSGFDSRPNFSAPLNPTCAHYTPNQWMEFTGRIEIIGAANAPSSRVQLWVNGQLVIDNPNAMINWGSSDGDGLGSFLASTYLTNKDSSQVTDNGFTWFDDVIVSTQPIPMTTSSNSAVPMTPVGLTVR
jgi:hypothetical protein